MAPGPGVSIDAAVINITGNSGECGGTLTWIGGSTVLAKGLVWSSVNSDPTLLDSFVDVGAGGATDDYYSAVMTGLNGMTHYYVKAYVTTDTHGVSYSMAIEFDTVSAPMVSKVMSGPGGKQMVVGAQRLIIKQ